MQVSTIPGSNFSARRQSTNAQAPQLQFADEVAEAQNQKYTNVSLGGSASGPLLMDRNFYNTSAQYGRRFQDLPSLLSTNAVGLASAGVASDSVSRLLGILNSAKIPATVSGLGNQTVTDDIRVQTNIDISPSNNGTGDMFTFGLGSAVAGLGGVALSQIGNVGPELGQGYIVDSFMVVVVGSVGNLFGTLYAAVGLGAINKLLEPVAGAVLGKIFVLGFIILFIQRRPQGLFALKGRAAES